MPIKLKKNALAIKKQNPDWIFILWDDEMIIDLLKKRYPNIYNIYININKLSGFITSNATKSDIGRYIIMKEYGGLYYDLDFECIKPLKNLFNLSNNLKTTTTITTTPIYIGSSKIDFLDYVYPLDKPKYCACFMGFEREHPIWNIVIDKIINAKTKKEIGESLDNTLKINENKYTIIILDKIKGPYQCGSNSICHTPSASSWNPIRPLLKKINCNGKISIIVLFLIIFEFYLIWQLKNYNYK